MNFLFRTGFVLSIAACFWVTGAAMAASGDGDGVPRDPAWEAAAGLFGHGDWPEQAEALRRKGRYAKAAKRYLKMAAKATRPESRVYAYTRAGDCHFEARNYNSAFDAYESALEGTAMDIKFDHVLERIRALAEKFEQGDGRFFGRSLSSAIEAWELIREIMPLSETAPSDRLHLANLYRENGDVEEATAGYRTLIEQYPGATEARYAHFHLAKMLLKRAAFGDQDGALTEEAANLLETYLEVAPEDTKKRERAENLLRSVREDRATTILERAQFYLWPAHHRPEAARRYLAKLQQPPYDNTAVAKQAVGMLRQLQDAQNADAQAGEGTDPTTKAPNAGRPLAKWLLPIGGEESSKGADQ